MCIAWPDLRLSTGQAGASTRNFDTAVASDTKRVLQRPGLWRRDQRGA
jgi:hypothetical protein